MIILVGPVGAGKSVQAQKLVKRLDMQWISTGEMLRSSQDPRIQAKLHSGELLDDQDVQEVLETAIKDVESRKDIVMDGFPRRVSQAEWLSGKLPEWERELEFVVHIKVDESEAKERMSLRGRHDDSDDAIKQRNQEYVNQVLPMVDHYREARVLVEVNGIGTVEEVADRIQEAIGR